MLTTQHSSASINGTCVIEDDFLYIAPSLNESTLYDCRPSHVVTFGRDTSGTALFDLKVPHLIIDTSTVSESLCDCVLSICNFVNTSISPTRADTKQKQEHASTSAQSTPCKSEDSQSIREPHSRYSSYDSTATRTPPHAGFTWRNVGTPSSCGTDAPRTPTPGCVSPVVEGADEDASVCIDTGEEGSPDSVHATVHNPVFSTPCKLVDEKDTEDKQDAVVLLVCDVNDFLSTTLATALMMQVMNMSLRDAFATVLARAPAASIAPTDSCVQALLVYERTLNPNLAFNSISQRELFQGEAFASAPVPPATNEQMQVAEASPVQMTDVSPRVATSTNEESGKAESSSCTCCVIM